MDMKDTRLQTVSFVAKVCNMDMDQPVPRDPRGQLSGRSAIISLSHSTL